MLDQIVKAKIKSDAMFNLTPDLPKLRFGGPIKVFLWGKYSRFETMFDIFTKHKCDNLVDFKTLTTYTKTQSGHVLLDNTSYDKDKGGYMQYVPETWATLATYTKDPLTKAPICGRLISVSVKGIKALDTHFNNTITFGRKKITTKEGDLAWCYFVPELSLMKYNPHEKKYYPLTNLNLKRAPLSVIGADCSYGAV